MTSSSSITGQVNQTASGRTYVTGTVSGLDTNSLIQSAVSAKIKDATTLSNKITTNVSKISAYKSLQSQVSSLETALDALKSSVNSKDSSNTSSSSTSSVFSSKGVSYSTSDGSTASNILTATADGTAANGSHTVIVKQIAQAEQVTGSSQSSNSTALGYNGSFSLNIDGNTAASISITSDMSLQDIKSTINAQSSTAGVNADILQVSNGSYKLVLSGSDTNKEINVSVVSGDDVLTGLGITSSKGGSFVNISQAAQPAKITLDGTENITSDTNSFSNILTGLSISVVSASPDTTINLKITNNTDGVKTALNNLISAYNSISDTITSNHQVNNDGSIPSSETLYGDSILNLLGQQINQVISGTGNNSSNSYNSLGALGITLDSDNHLTISNQTVLDDALNNHFSDVQSLFSTQFSTSNANLSVSQNNSNLNASFSLAIITDGSGNITSASVSGDSSLFTISGNKLIGNSGTIYEGLTLNYSGTNSSTITVSLKQGLADKLVNLLDGYNDTSNGTIAKEITSLQTNDTTMQAKIDAINAEGTKYESTLIDKYAKMEAAIQKAQLTSQTIKALTGSSSSSS